MHAPRIAKSWREAITRRRWKERAEAWDEAPRLELEIEWQRRRDELREQEWKAWQALFETLKQNEFKVRRVYGMHTVGHRTD